MHSWDPIVSAGSALFLFFWEKGEGYPEMVPPHHFLIVTVLDCNSPKCATSLCTQFASWDFWYVLSHLTSVLVPPLLPTYLHEDDGRVVDHSSRAVDRDGKRPGRRSPRTEKRPSENSKNIRACTHHDGSSSLIP